MLDDSTPISGLFRDITLVSTLARAYQKVRDNRGAPGVDRVSVEAYAFGLEGKLERLSEELRSGHYWPDPVRLVDVPKRSGGTRTLAIPTVGDRVAQTAAALILTPKLDAEFEDASFGYRQGRSVLQAVRRVDRLRREGFVWTVDADIDAYFDSVPHKPLLARLKRSIDCPHTLDLVERWLEAYAPNGRGLPQGSPISPLLANLYLDDLDEAFGRGGVRLVRFADDFVLLAKSESGAEAALAKARAVLAERGLALDPDKTRIVPYEAELTFLGHRFVRGMMLAAEPPEPSEEAIAQSAPSTDALAEAGELPIGDEPAGHAPRLRTLYLVEPHRMLDVHGKGFCVRDGELLALVLPAGRIDRIEIGPAAEASAAAVRRAGEEGLPLAFVNGAGHAVAELMPMPFDRARVHLAQAGVALDSARAADLARRLVEGRLRNQRALLARLNRRRKDAAIAKAAHEIGRLARLARRQETIDGVRGVEGRGGTLFWPALGATFIEPFGLTTRVRHPPPDPVNLVLNVLAGLVTRNIGTLILRRGLHPGFGVLHPAQDDRPSLALDLIEIFRAALIEGHAVYVFNNRVLTPDSFTSGAAGVPRLWTPAMKTLIRHHESWLSRSIESRRSNRRTTWRGLMEEEIGAYLAHVTGEAVYEPYVMKF